MNVGKTKYQLDVINRIKELRIEKGVSQQKLASLLLISNGQIGNIESPKYQHKYTLKQLYSISCIFCIPFNQLLIESYNELSTEEIIKLLIKYDE